MILQYFDKYASLRTEAQKLQNDTKAHAPHYQLIIVCFKVDLNKKSHAKQVFFLRVLFF